MDCASVLCYSRVCQLEQWTCRGGAVAVLKQQADKQTSYKDLPRNMIPVPSTVNTTPILATVQQPSLLLLLLRAACGCLDHWNVFSVAVSTGFYSVRAFVLCHVAAVVSHRQWRSSIPPSHAYFLSNNDICLPINWQMLTCLSSLLLGFQILI